MTSATPGAPGWKIDGGTTVAAGCGFAVVRDSSSGGWRPRTRLDPEISQPRPWQGPLDLGLGLVPGRSRTGRRRLWPSPRLKGPRRQRRAHRSAIGRGSPRRRVRWRQTDSTRKHT